MIEKSFFLKASFEHKQQVLVWKLPYILELEFSSKKYFKYSQATYRVHPVYQAINQDFPRIVLLILEYSFHL